MIQHFIIVENPDRWNIAITGVAVVSAKKYLTDPAFSNSKRARIINLCRSYRYQSLGYYVSLIAEARGHKPLPKISTIQDVKLITRIRRAVSDELEEDLNKQLASVSGNSFTLNIYFSKAQDRRFDRLARQIFNAFPAPTLRAVFQRSEDGWILKGLTFVPASEIPLDERPIVIAAANEFLKHAHIIPKIEHPRFNLAILYDPTDPSLKPSNPKAMRSFIKAAEALDIDCELITKDDFGRLGEFDGLFIRETTAVNSFTFGFARKAEREGLVVMDDPQSILKCSNKVFLAELMQRHRVPVPRTVILVQQNLKQPLDLPLPLPLILKKPDSSFSQGVVKVSTPEEYKQKLEELLETSEMVVAQEFTPTEFDWRIGVLDGKILYACRYWMAPKHWQIYNHMKRNNDRFGNVDCVPLDQVPPVVLKTAQRATDAIGNGFYGADIKMFGDRCLLIEVNDNPSIDAGVEDQLLKDKLYHEVMACFLRRMEEYSAPDQPPAPKSPSGGKDGKQSDTPESPVAAPSAAEPAQQPQPPQQASAPAPSAPEPTPPAAGPYPTDVPSA